VRESVSHSVAAVLGKSLSEKELTFLAHYCHTVAKAIISTYHQKHLRSATAMNYDLDSLAWRCIGDLFSTRNCIWCFELHIYFTDRVLLRYNPGI